MSEWNAFIQTINENPNDPVPRLVFADWCAEHGMFDAEKIMRCCAWVLGRKIYTCNQIWYYFFDCKKSSNVEFSLSFGQKFKIKYTKFGNGALTYDWIYCDCDSGFFNEFGIWYVSSNNDTRYLDQPEITCASLLNQFCDQLIKSKATKTKPRIKLYYEQANTKAINKLSH